MKKGKCGEKSFPSSGVGEILAQSLTMDQIAHLLDVVFAAEDTGRYSDGFKKADPDMAETVEKVLAMNSGEIPEPQPGRLASNQRILEHWNSLWEQWDTIVLDVGEEEGEYAVQDAHWETPYFAGYALAADLDEIAADMVGVIDGVYNLVKNPDLFQTAMEEINSNISSYPEWMGEEEGCTLGKNTTRCVLRWLWLASHKDLHPGRTFLARVYELEDEFDMVYLDDDESIAFFAELPDAVCQEIYECFGNEERREKRDDVYSKWHKINHLYQKRFDSTRYLETCGKHLAKNWQYGKPLIDDAIAQGDYQKADSLLEQTFSSCLNRDEKNTWRPETSLLLTQQSYYRGDDEEKIAELLESWGRVAENLSNTKRSAALRLQSVIYHAPEDWDTVICEYKKLRLTEVKDVVGTLFSEWQTTMARRSIHDRMDNNVSSDTWIHWLIEARLDMTGKKEWFLKKLDAWLDHLKEDEKLFEQEWSLLARLTKDLPGSGSLQKSYPSFFKVVLPSNFEPSPLGKARCKGLREMDTDIFLSRAMGIWKSHLRHLVPDPANSHTSNYQEHVKWIKALHELSRDGYNALLARWNETHKRRRNLWREMKKHQLPI